MLRIEQIPLVSGSLFEKPIPLYKHKRISNAYFVPLAKCCHTAYQLLRVKQKRGKPLTNTTIVEEVTHARNRAQFENEQNADIEQLQLDVEPLRKKRKPDDKILNVVVRGNATRVLSGSGPPWIEIEASIIECLQEEVANARALDACDLPRGVSHLVIKGKDCLRIRFKQEGKSKTKTIDAPILEKAVRWCQAFIDNDYVEPEELPASDDSENENENENASDESEH